MALLLSPPPPVQKARARFANLTASKEDGRSLWVGLVLTLLIWPTCVWLVSLVVSHFGEQAQKNLSPSAPPPPVFSIELNQDEFQIPTKAPKETPPPPRFVETNPDAPENTPDETRNIGAHNQQVAQEKPTPDHKSDTPSTKGERKEETTQIVSGSLQSQPQDAPPPPPPSPELMQAVQEAQQQRERNPLPGDVKITGESDSGYGFNIGKIAENMENIPERVEGGRTAPLIVGNAQATTQKVEPQRPQPRPRLDRKVRPAVLADRPLGTSNLGITSYDARWSQYGQYLQRLIDSVQIEWERILGTFKAQPPPGSVVTVTFVINAKGEISEIVKTESNAGTQGTRACQSAITSRAPYGDWTDDMIAAMGEQQEMTFSFYYY